LILKGLTTPRQRRWGRAVPLPAIDMDEDDRRYYFDCLQAPQARQVQAILRQFEPLHLFCLAPGHGPLVRFSPDGVAESSCLILTDALVYLECTIQDRVAAGDHQLVYTSANLPSVLASTPGKGGPRPNV